MNKNDKTTNYYTDMEIAKQKIDELLKSPVFQKLFTEKSIASHSHFLPGINISSLVSHFKRSVEFWVSYHNNR